MTRRLIATLLLGVLGSALFAAPAAAAQAEPAVIAQAWFWETQQNQNIDTPVGSVSGELPNPFCPGLPSGLGAPPETCAEGRLPVEVLLGDYETPDKVSAIAFDLTMVTEGSKIASFKLEMMEAETGCYEKPASLSGQQCEETGAINVDGKQVQACEVTEIFGDAEARPYKEMPKYTCDGAVLGKRTEVKNDGEADPTDTDPDFVWTFDLTPLAQKWAQAPPLCTCVMFRPLKPKEVEEGAPAEDWRVVFVGPKFAGGIETELRFTPGSGGGLPPLAPFAPTTTGTGSTGSTSSFGDTSVGGGLDTGSGDTGTTDGGDAAAADGATDEPVAATDDAAPTGATAPEIENMPWYVWLAILAGVVGWSLVRSVVLDTVHGQRPNGVLAQIHRINAARGGALAAAASSGDGALAGLKSGFAAIAGALEPVTSKFSSLAGKLPGIKKG